jgi:hypothetical protein
MSNCMKEGAPLEANSRLADLEILRRLWKSKVHYLHRNPPQAPIRCQINSVRIFTFKLRCNIILPSALISCKCFFFRFRFQTLIVYAFLTSPLCNRCSCPVVILYLIILLHYYTVHSIIQFRHNATIYSFTFPLHMFRPHSDIIRCFYLAKTVILY